MKHYSVKEIFYSPQGEGHRAGTMNIFIRFAGCNLQCVVEREGFNCDTDFAKGTPMTAEEILASCKDPSRHGCTDVIFTGGEPTLQLDKELQFLLAAAGFYLAVETNGTRKVLTRSIVGFGGIDYVACSPKPGSPPALLQADEVRCVVRDGQKPRAQRVWVPRGRKFVSPACRAPTADLISQHHASAADFDPEAIAWVVKWCRENPDWRISLQTHKILGVA